MTFIREHSVAIVWSIALHIAVAAGLAIGLPLPERSRVPVAAAPIQAVLVDTVAIERERETREQATRQENQRRQREEREAAEQQRVADQREQQRVTDAQRVAAEKERERIAAAKREQEQSEAQAREQKAREQREREAAAKREREQADQRRREAELQAAIATEGERAAAEAAGLLDQYIRMIENRIKQHWDRPLSARPGIDCKVNVVQTMTGDVVSAKVATCNGDDAVRRSIERAVMDASPLPRPPTPALFERSLNVSFRPDE